MPLRGPRASPPTFWGPEATSLRLSAVPWVPAVWYQPTPGQKGPFSRQPLPGSGEREASPGFGGERRGGLAGGQKWGEEPLREIKGSHRGKGGPPPPTLRPTRETCRQPCRARSGGRDQLCPHPSGSCCLGAASCSLGSPPPPTPGGALSAKPPLPALPLLPGPRPDCRPVTTETGHQGAAEHRPVEPQPHFPPRTAAPNPHVSGNTGPILKPTFHEPGVRSGGEHITSCSFVNAPGGVARAAEIAPPSNRCGYFHHESRSRGRPEGGAEEERPDPDSAGRRSDRLALVRSARNPRVHGTNSAPFLRRNLLLQDRKRVVLSPTNTPLKHTSQGAGW